MKRTLSRSLSRAVLKLSIRTLGGYRVWLLRGIYRRFMRNTAGQVLFGVWMGWGLGLLIF